MRELIKPGLFWWVRLGLLVSVAAWILGQWWWTQLSFYKISVASSWGTLTASDSPQSSWGATVTALREGPFGEVRNWARHRATFVEGAGILKVPGVMFASNTGGHIIEFHYWPIVAFFALSYVALHFIYRRRPESPPCKV